jgi:Tfp pilus assembly protein PilX
MKQSGYILFITLIFTLLISIFGISMMRTFSSLEDVAGGVREKNRANESAQAALYYAEWRLLASSQSATVNATCSGSLSTTPASSPVICSNTLTNTTASGSSVFDPNVTYIASSSSSFNVSTMVKPWSAYNIYKPLNMNISTSSVGGVDSNSMANYFTYPIFYIQKLGTPSITSKSGSTDYLITAMGFGGNKNEISVIQSVYELTSGYGTDVTGQ